MFAVQRLRHLDMHPRPTWNGPYTREKTLPSGTSGVQALQGLAALGFGNMASDDASDNKGRPDYQREKKANTTRGLSSALL